MNKQIMIDTITSKLSKIGISVQNNIETDIEIHKEFLDAKWGSGNKKIDFYASAYFDDSQQTLFYWEFTKDIGGGFSYGNSSETSFQSGMALMRKVKSVGYGLDGKAYEYKIDLGAITKIFKETAKQNGWKFKVVLSKEKASYPAGYIMNTPQATSPQPVYQPASTPVQETPVQQYIQPQPTSVKIKSKKTSVFFKVVFITIIILTAVFFGLSDVSITGWIVAVILFTVIFLARRFISKNIIIGLVIWLLSLLILLMTLGLTTPL